METIIERRKRVRDAMRKYRARHPDRVKKSRLIQYNKRKERAFLIIGGAVCKKCGCDELSFLEFNHKNGGGCQEHRRNHGTPIMDRILSKKRDVTDLECLCRVCNAIDYLSKKNPEAAKKYKVIYTGQKAQCLK